ncbi:hypothetical protein COO91_05579 [Nostoc flagelliforme CCNUN1]|uniref:Uncharacterized protein n=1 Tax=Nostoc flagelliforme CCNUN1 TaxID=2038116 RepID=A0A2K8SW70_9NOSO|nr:hypothetical protein COO91_05579 [Nostoc flagelliforme CCNUN1]
MSFVLCHLLLVLSEAEVFVICPLPLVIIHSPLCKMVKTLDLSLKGRGEYERL